MVVDVFRQYPTELLEQIVELARQHSFIFFFDEIFDRLVMDGNQYTSIASLAHDLFVVTLNGLSKSHMINVLTELYFEKIMP